MAKNKNKKKSEKPVEQTQEITVGSFDDDFDSYDNAMGTIFSADSDAETGSTKASKKADKSSKTSGNKKTIIIIVSIIIVIAGLIGIYFIVQNNVPDANDSTMSTYPTDENGEQYAVDLKGNKIESEKDNNGNILVAGIEELISYVPADIKTVKVTNENGTFEISGETATEVTTENGSEVITTNATVYTLKGYEEAPLASGKPDAVANDAASVTTTNIVDITGKNPETYGFDKPRATVEVKFNDGKQAKIIVGNEAPDNAGSYLMVNDDKAIYLVDNEDVDSFLYKETAFLDPTITDTAESDESSTPDKATISGTNFKDTLEFEANDDVTVSGAYYKMTAPTKGFVNVANGSSVLGALRSISATEAVAFKPNNETLKKFGIDTENPFAELKANFGEKTIHLYGAKPVIAESDDESSSSTSSTTYIYNPDKKMVYLINTSSVGWVTTSYEDMVYEYVLKADMPYIKTMEITANSKAYTFDISTETNTDSEGNETSKTVVKSNGKTIEQSRFDTFFQNLESAQLTAVKSGKISGKADLTVKISYTEDKSDDTITFYKGDNGKYNFSTDGSTLKGEVFESYVQKIIEDAPKIANGDEITAI